MPQEQQAATYDPVATAMEQAGTRPQEQSDSPAPRQETMGSGLFDTGSGSPASSERSGQSGGAGQAEGDAPASAPTSTAPESQEDKDARLRWQDYTQKTTQLAQERDVFRQEREAWLKTREEAQRQPQQGPHPGTPAPLSQQMYAFAQRLAADPTVSPTDRDGIAFMARAVETVEAQATLIEDLKSQLGQITPKVEQASQVASQLTQREHQAIMGRLQTEAAQARKQFGEETYRSLSGVLMPFLTQSLQGQPIVNPATQQPYTIPELVAGFTGRTAQEAGAAADGNRRGVQVAKAGAAVPRGTAAAPAPAGGYQTREQAIAEIRATRSAAGLG